MIGPGVYCLAPVAITPEDDRHAPATQAQCRQQVDDTHPCEHHEQASQTAAGRDRIEVAVADRRDRHHRPPERITPGDDVRIRRLALELGHQHARQNQHQERQQHRDERGVLPAVPDHVLNQLLLVLPAQDTRDPCQPAQPRQAKQRRELEEPKARNRTEQVQPSTLLDEVVGPRPRPAQVQREIDQEHAQITLS